MFFLFRRSSARSFRRRLLSAFLAAMYAITAAGVPIPTGGIAGNSGELYPCAGHACGCQSAEQCWRSCCCFSLAERMGWAERHGVRPPEFAIAEARSAGMEVAWLGQPGGCCHGRGGDVRVKTCVLAAQPPAMPKAACKNGATPSGCCCCGRHAHETTAATSTHDHRVVGWRALECQGKTSNWLAATPTWIRVHDAAAQHLILTGWLGPALSDHAICVSELPATPPPKAA